MDAPTPRKSKRVPISLAAWLRALSASGRLMALTMSNEDSAGIVAPSPVGHSPTVKRLLRSGEGPGQGTALRVDGGRWHRVNRLRRVGGGLKGASPARPRRALFSQGRAVFAFPETLAAAIPSARPSAPSRLSSGPRDGAVLPSQPLGAGGIGPACGVQLAGPGKVPAVTCTCRKQPGVRYPSLCRPVKRHKAGCPRGQRERSVKPSASPSQVRILDLPPVKAGFSAPCGQTPWNAGSGSGRCGTSDSQVPGGSREASPRRDQEQHRPPDRLRREGAPHEGNGAKAGQDDTSGDAHARERTGVAVLPWRDHASHARSRG